jgi:hypothetical protein
MRVGEGERGTLAELPVAFSPHATKFGGDWEQTAKAKIVPRSVALRPPSIALKRLGLKKLAPTTMAAGAKFPADGWRHQRAQETTQRKQNNPLLGDA